MDDLTNGRFEEAKAFARKNNDETLFECLRGVDAIRDSLGCKSYIVTGFKPMQFNIILKKEKVTHETHLLQYTGRIENMGSSHWPSPDDETPRWTCNRITQTKM